MFMWMVFSQLLNFSWPNLVWSCIITGQSVMQEDWFAVFMFRVRLRACIIRYDCAYHIYWTADLSGTKFNGWYITVSWSVFLCKNLIVVFKTKVTVKVQNFIESLFTLYLLHYWPLGNQTRCADILLLVTKPSTTKWAYTDSSTLTYSITGHTVGGWWWWWWGGVLFCQARRQIVLNYGLK